MIRARAVVAQHFGGGAADKQRTEMREARRDQVRIVKQELEVFGRERVARHNPLLHV